MSVTTLRLRIDSLPGMDTHLSRERKATMSGCYLVERYMRSSTMLSPEIITDLEVARLLEKEFNASWLPEYSKCSIFTDCALVVVDMDRHFSPGSLGVTTEEIEKQMGFVVKTAFYIHSSI